MKTFSHLSILLAISICISLFVQGQAATNDSSRQGSTLDTGKSKLSPKDVPKKDNTFKLLPKFNDRKDTAGFRLIPPHKDDPDFVPYDKEPQIIKKVEPKYPEPAKRAGLEGKVIVKMWVDRDGKVKKVVVLKSDAAVFNQPAIEAAKQFVFAPAYVDNKPVAVWISYPFRFRLPDNK